MINSLSIKRWRTLIFFDFNLEGLPERLSEGENNARAGISVMKNFWRWRVAHQNPHKRETFSRRHSNSFSSVGARVGSYSNMTGAEDFSYEGMRWKWRTPTLSTVRCCQFVTSLSSASPAHAYIYMQVGTEMFDSKTLQTNALPK